MANISNYLEEAILNHIMRNTEYVRPSAVYAGLVTNIATDEDLENGTLTNEITAYTGNRKPITFKEPTQVDGKATIYNDGVIDFVNMPSTIIKYIIVCDAATGGNILYWCPLFEGATKTTNSGDTFRLIDEGLVLDID
jgi:hypothetical protein